MLSRATGVNVGWWSEDLEIVSEASRHLSDELKARHPEIPWSKVAGIGNVLRHEYERIASDVLWRVAQDDLPLLDEVCREELAKQQAREELAATVSPDLRPTLEAPDDDPYLWLEEIDGERALAWVEAQNAATLARFGDARFAADRDTLAAIFDRPDNIPLIARRGVRGLQFLEGRGASTRAVAGDDARQLPQRAARVGHPARSRRTGG